MPRMHLLRVGFRVRVRVTVIPRMLGYVLADGLHILEWKIPKTGEHGSY